MNNYYKSGRYEKGLRKAWEYNKKKKGMKKCLNNRQTKKQA